MGNLIKLLFSFILSAVFCLTINSASFASDGLYIVEADDGVKLSMKRYRPEPGAAFNDGQPVLLIPGIGSNMYEFITHTPETRHQEYSDMVLPEPIAEWAVGDKYIQKDPMKYYSIMHYLWLKGYDPWLSNYRGTCRGDFESEMGSIYTNIDVWGAVDVPAWIDKIIEVTGKNPVIGGHSTGGFASYSYLQGTYMDPDELDAGYENGYIPHVRNDTNLAAERNSKIKGFIAIDPGCIPPAPDFFDNTPMWIFLGSPIYLDFDWIAHNVVNPYIKDSGIVIAGLDLIFGTIHILNKQLGEYIDLFSYFDIAYVHNIHPYVEDFFGRYALTSVYMRGISQWFNIALRNRICEHWKNGEENKNVVVPPQPDPGNDGYYYYDDNMYLVTVPTIAVLSEAIGLVDTDNVVELLMNNKTKHQHDEWHMIPDTAHIDIICGYNTPAITFPKIGTWLDKICNDEVTDEVSGEDAGSDGVTVVTDDKTDPAEDEEIYALADNSSSAFACGSTANASFTNHNTNYLLPGILNIICMMVLPLIMIYLHRLNRKN